jgi:hypothetical protein
LDTLAYPFGFVDFTSLFDTCHLPNTSTLATKMNFIYVTTLEKSRESIHYIFRQSSPSGTLSRHTSISDLTVSESTCSFSSHLSSNILL